jgi:hypothetical protein
MEGQLLCNYKTFLEARTGVEPVMEVLQTSALPTWLPRLISKKTKKMAEYSATGFSGAGDGI